MKNFSHKKGCNSGITQVNVETPKISLIKVKYDGKSDKYFVKLKMCSDPTPSTSDLYEFKMIFFENGDPGEFLLFVHNFNMAFLASGIMDMGAKIQYLRTLVRGELLRQFDSLSTNV